MNLDKPSILTRRGRGLNWQIHQIFAFFSHVYTQYIFLQKKFFILFAIFQKFGVQGTFKQAPWVMRKHSVPTLPVAPPHTQAAYHTIQSDGIAKSWQRYFNYLTDILSCNNHSLLVFQLINKITLKTEEYNIK